MTVRFEHVDFAYAADRPLLREVSFELRPGQTLAVVGATGSGKSSLARLLYRFYPPTAGAITVNGQHIDHWTTESLRRRIAVVPQEPVLFNGSLGDNICYGEAAPDPQVVQEVLAATQLADWIARLPQGLNTPVGERGLKLSGLDSSRRRDHRAGPWAGDRTGDACNAVGPARPLCRALAGADCAPSAR